MQNELEKNFLLRLSSGANIILQKTEVNPVTIPLPQSNEYFALTYNNGVRSDTLFNNLAERNITGKDSIYKTENLWSIATHKTLETGGVINVLYALSAKDYNAAIQQLRLLLFIYIPVAILISFVAGYFLSGIFLKPLNNIITKANETDLTNNIKLLDAPVVKDELHELVDALNRMLTRIEKQSQQQNAFFASASHELRTPLSNMLTELQTIETGNISASMQSLVQHQTTEVQRLKKLVNNFLLMSQLKADSVYVHKINFNITELCIEIIQSLQLSAAQNNQLFKLDISPEDADFTVFADKDHLSVVLNNFLMNAIKYGEHNSTIKISIVKNNDSIHLIVENKTNVAIENINSLKEQFIRADFYKEGFGLGLWIAAQLMEKNHGEMKLVYQDKIFTASLRILQRRHILSEINSG